VFKLTKAFAFNSTVCSCFFIVKAFNSIASLSCDSFIGPHASIQSPAFNSSMVLKVMPLVASFGQHLIKI
jgi:hypothetical protein